MVEAYLEYVINARKYFYTVSENMPPSRPRKSDTTAASSPGGGFENFGCALLALPTGSPLCLYSQCA
jgi:hypothetical protein